MLTVVKNLIIGALLLGAAINSKSVWWETSNDLYSFSTDLDKAKGGKFVKDAMRTMDALRKSYEQYVPKQKEIGKCKVKVFKSLKGYNEYIGRPDNTTNVGMWRPMQEELLIVAEERSRRRSRCGTRPSTSISTMPRAEATMRCGSTRGLRASSRA